MLGLVWLACNTFNLYLELTYFLSILPKALPLCTDTNSVCVSESVCEYPAVLSDKAEIEFSPTEP